MILKTFEDFKHIITESRMSSSIPKPISTLMQDYKFTNKEMFYKHLISLFQTGKSKDFKRLYNLIGYKSRDEFRNYANKEIKKYIEDNILVKSFKEPHANYVYNEMIENALDVGVDRLVQCKSDIKKITEVLNSKEELKDKLWHRKINFPYYSEHYSRLPVVEVLFVFEDYPISEELFAAIESKLNLEFCIDIKYNITEKIIYLYY